MKYLILAAMLVPSFAFASVDITSVVVSGNVATINGIASEGQTNVSVDGNTVYSTVATNWSTSNSYNVGNHNAVAQNENDYDSASFSIGGGGGGDPWLVGTVYADMAAGRTVYLKAGVGECPASWFAGCFLTIENPIAKTKNVKYGEEGCYDPHGCTITL